MKTRKTDVRMVEQEMETAKEVSEKEARLFCNNSPCTSSEKG